MNFCPESSVDICVRNWILQPCYWKLIVNNSWFFCLCVLDCSILMFGWGVGGECETSQDFPFPMLTAPSHSHFFPLMETDAFGSCCSNIWRLLTAVRSFRGSLFFSYYTYIGSHFMKKITSWKIDAGFSRSPPSSPFPTHTLCMTWFQLLSLPSRGSLLCCSVHPRISFQGERILSRKLTNEKQ